MKRWFNLSSLKRVALLAMVAVGLLFTTFSHSSAQSDANLQMEGQARYRFERYGRRPWRVTVSLDRLVNYSYQNRYDHRLLFVLSRRPYRPGYGVSGTLMAQERLPIIEARTAYNNISFAANKRVRRGTYRAILVLVDAGNYIVQAINFPSTARFRS
jgi:hypothetical protein